jgi:hypothetical protein
MHQDLALPSLDEKSRRVMRGKASMPCCGKRGYFLLVKLTEARTTCWGVRLRLTLSPHPLPCLHHFPRISMEPLHP